MESSRPTDLLRDSRGASTLEYVGIFGTVAALGVAAFIGLGGSMGTAIGGSGNGGGMVTSSQAGEVVTADHPRPGGSHGGGGSGGGSEGTGGDSGGFAVGEGRGLVSGGVPNILDRVGSGHGGNGHGGRSGNGDNPRAGGGLWRNLANLATLPARVVSKAIRSGEPGAEGFSASCFNPMNTIGCVVDAAKGKASDLKDTAERRLLERIAANASNDRPEPPGKDARELPVTDVDDFRVLSINAANAYTCKSGKDGEPGALETDCEGDPGHYRTSENRRRLAGLLDDAGAQFVAMQEIMAGNPGFGDGLDTGLRTAARVNDDFSVFLEGEPNEDYLVTDLGTPCQSLPCKQISPDGTVLYRTESGTYISSATICSGGKDDTCPDGTKRNRDGSLKDPYFGSWDVAERHLETVDEHGKKQRRTKVQRPDDEDRRYGNSVLVMNGDEEVADAYTVVLPHKPGSSPPPLDVDDREALNRYNNNARLGYKEVDKEKADHQPRAAMVTVVRSPDGTERVVINVHLARRGEDPEVQRSQLEAVADLVAQASKGGREVVVTGDFNMKPPVVADVFDGAGLNLAGGDGIDQVWVLDGVDTKHGSDVESAGASDHEVGATATLE